MSTPTYSVRAEAEAAAITAEAAINGPNATAEARAKGRTWCRKGAGPGAFKPSQEARHSSISGPVDNSGRSVRSSRISRANGKEFTDRASSSGNRDSVLPWTAVLADSSSFSRCSNAEPGPSGTEISH